MRNFSWLKVFYALTLLLVVSSFAQPAAAIDLFNKAGSKANTHHAYNLSAEAAKKRPSYKVDDFNKANAAHKASVNGKIKTLISARQAQTAKNVASLRATLRQESAARKEKNATAVKQAQSNRAAALQASRSASPVTPVKAATTPATATTAPVENTPDLFNTPAGGTGGTRPVFGIQ